MIAQHVLEKGSAMVRQIAESIDYSKHIWKVKVNISQGATSLNLQES
jgi:hypothetical protein